MIDHSSHKASGPAYLRVLGTLVALGLLIYLLSQQGWQEISSAVRQIPPWRLAAALLLMAVSRLAVSGRWYILLRCSSAKISLGQSLRITFAGLFATNFLPTTVGGDVVRLAGALQLRLDAAVSAASLIVDRLVGMAGMAMAVPFGLPRFLAGGLLQPAGLLPGDLQVMGGTAVLARLSWSRSIIAKAWRIVHKLLAAMSIWLKQPRALLLSLAFTWVNMLCLFSILYLLLNGMGEPVSIGLIGGLYSIVYFFTLIPITINGYGLQELSMYFVFTHAGGISESSALTAALLFRTLMMLASLPGAAFIPGMLHGAEKHISPEN